MDGWNPWKITTIAMLLMLATALVTGSVVANWKGGGERTAAGTSKDPARPSTRPATPAPPAPRAAATPVTRPQRAVPPPDVVEACNRHASAQAGERDKTMDTVKNVAVGAVVGAAVGAAGGAIADGGKGAGKGAGVGGVLGAGAGTLYGLNENRKHDERYRDAYAGCLRARGYAG